MCRLFFLVGFAFTLINCASIESNRLQVNERNPRQESLKRARGLSEIGETNAALKALSGILKMQPIDAVTLEALNLFVDLQLRANNARAALDKIEEIYPLAQRDGIDLTVLDRIKKLAQKGPSKKIKKDVLPIKEEAKEIRPPGRLVAHTIGVVLPLSGNFKVYGDRTLAALRLALPMAQEFREGDAIFLKRDGITIIVKDSMGLSEVSQRVVESLVADHGVGIILGDILSETAIAVAKTASKFDVISVALSRKDNITKYGSRVFQMAMTPSMQAKKLLSYMKSRDLQRVAIFYPESSFGIEMKDAFVSAAGDAQMVIKRAVGYKPSETTYTAHIKKLVGPKIVSGNAQYEKCQAKANLLADFAAKQKAEKNCLDNVAPSIDFDALFIPDFPKNLGYIVPALISEGVMVSANPNMVRSYKKTMGENARTVLLLGPNTYNNASMAKKLGTQLEGAVFTDWLEPSPHEQLNQFRAVFEQISGSAPYLPEILAFDAMSLIINTVGQFKKDREIELNELTQMLSIATHNGLAGVSIFENNRESNIPLDWFSFYEGKIVRGKEEDVIKTEEF